jgi:hypothetical protein
MLAALVSFAMMQVTPARPFYFHVPPAPPPPAQSPSFRMTEDDWLNKLGAPDSRSLEAGGTERRLNYVRPQCKLTVVLMQVDGGWRSRRFDIRWHDGSWVPLPQCLTAFGIKAVWPE